MKPKKALLIIDMQKASFKPEIERFDTHGVVSRINQLAAIFRTLDYPVIYIQHDGTGSGEFEKNTTGWENLDELIVEPNDIMIDKYVNDVFYESQLHPKLVALNINDIVVTGCATDFCVESTVQSALIKDYNITVVKDGHTTGKTPYMKGEKVVEHYNWVWTQMKPTKGTIEVKTLAEIKKNLTL